LRLYFYYNTGNDINFQPKNGERREQFLMKKEKGNNDKVKVKSKQLLHQIENRRIK
jgi:hypothetical protein